jgi:uncharacterized protein with HEPN domain
MIEAGLAEEIKRIYRALEFIALYSESLDSAKSVASLALQTRFVYKVEIIGTADYLESVEGEKK